MDRTPVHLMSDSESNESSWRFRAFGLKCPGNWAKDASLMELLEKSESCHVWFEKAEKPNVAKCGGFSVVFATVEEATANFEKVQKMTVDGNSLRVQASKSFCDAVKRLSTPEKPPLLFAVDPDGDAASDSTTDIRPLAHGNLSPQKNGSPRKQSTNAPDPSVESSTTAPSTLPPAVTAPEVTPEIVFDRFEEHISNHRINWAELNEVEDLWKLCDEVSKAFGGLPDSLLKEALMEVLEQHHDAATTPWMRSHIETLVKLWKKIVTSEKHVVREGMIESSAPVYVPYNPPAKRSQKGKNRGVDQKRAQMMACSIGQLLNHARIQFAKEDGELDIDEDEQGNFSIEGRELSFQSWGEMLKKQEESATKSQQKNRFSQAKYEKMLAKRDKRIRDRVQMEKKIKTMRAGLGNEDEDEQENRPIEEGDIGSENNSEKMTSRAKRKKARESLRQDQKKEDGEMSSDSEIVNATAGSSDSSSSSESSSDEENPRRRKIARKRAAARRSSAANTSMNVACEQYIERHHVNRFNLVQSLSAEQKATFLAILKETVNGTSPTQKNQLMKHLRAHLEKQVS
ncbi:hypothetical protein QR680_018835 [Steinernema hermaphroditum]|uniref:Uncharacterized protein n=1 Tax=Steinernema hermaphroditum TaxID=289476 RepID=A0AA39LQY3_9BILA|nr:hypothetical protein QR680_018835 [Steinernema hermaphroditum]